MTFAVALVVGELLAFCDLCCLRHTMSMLSGPLSSEVGHGRDDVKGKVSDGVGGALPCLAASSHLHRCLVVLAFSLTSHRPSGILIA